MGYNKNGLKRRKKSYRRRKKTLDLRKVGIAALSTVIAISLGYLVYTHLPFVKVNKAIAAGDKFAESADYESAIESYLKALDIDKTSVTAYSNLAGAYLGIDDTESAKKVLYEGYQNTQNQGLLDNYHTVILNEAVATMNDGNTDLTTVENIFGVLSEDNSNASAVSLLSAACDRTFTDSYTENANDLFRSGEESKPTYGEYSELVQNMLSVYQAAPSEELKGVVLDYLVPNSSSFTLDISNVSDYINLIDSVTAVVGSNDEVDSFRACLTNSQEVLAVFDDIFGQLDIGNVDELRSFVVSDEYIAIRDVFLNDEDTPLENTTYVPISREAIILNKSDEGWSYRFLDFEENPSTKGVITIWGNYFVDDGVQRASISYEPESIEDNPFPHTQYSVTYLYSYITKGSSTKVAQMNYRLDTTITYQDGTINETIVGDWGGSNEWTMDIDTIESRIRA